MPCFRPDDVFRRVERLARQRKVSRSQLYTAALIRRLEAEHQGSSPGLTTRHSPTTAAIV
jgi:predicted transcriptional regulator